MLIAANKDVYNAEIFLFIVSFIANHFGKKYYYAALIPRRGRILRRTLSVRLSVCLSVRLSVRPVMVTERHVAPPSELQ